MKTSPRFLCALSLTAVLACNSDDADEIELRDAQVSWDATSRVLADARIQLDLDNPGQYDGTLTMDCAEGGTLHVTRQRESSDEFELVATFAGCSHDGLTMDGELSLAASIAADVDEADELRDGSLAVLVEYAGWLELTGDVEGLCVVDAELRVGAATIDDRTTVGVAVSGTLCGHDAADVVRDEAQD
jgi:hypothetical protein